MPWSAKAQDLLRTQYAAVGAAARRRWPTAVAGRLRQAAATRRRCAATAGRRMRGRLSDGRTASSTPTATTAGRSRRSTDLQARAVPSAGHRGHVHTDRDHIWHMETLGRVCRGRPATCCSRRRTGRGRRPTRRVEARRRALVGGADRPRRRGMVVKPLDFVASGRAGLVQPAVKCRGREYLRIIYGPDTRPENLERLRSRGLGRKRSLALREFASASRRSSASSRRAAAAGPRVRLRRAGAGERTGRPAALTE